MRYSALFSLRAFLASRGLVRAMVYGAVCWGVLACTDGTENPQPSQSTQPAENTEPRESYEGVWRITDAKFPGVSAMGMEEAREWFGSEARLSASQVSFQDELCEQPSFHVNTLNESEFYTYYRARFDGLNIDDETVDIVEVGCPDYWGVPGSMLVQVSDNLAYLPWDGVFFQVEKAD